jgi:hypothetical protein
LEGNNNNEGNDNNFENPSIIAYISRQTLIIPCLFVLIGGATSNLEGGTTATITTEYIIAIC